MLCSISVCGCVPFSLSLFYVSKKVLQTKATFYELKENSASVGLYKLVENEKLSVLFESYKHSDESTSFSLQHNTHSIKSLENDVNYTSTERHS